MRFENSYNVRTANQSDRQNLADLIHFETHVQRHLEWRSALDWLGHNPYKILERNGKMVAAMACPPDPPQIGWIRLFAASSGISLEKAWRMLWQAIQVEIKSKTNADRIVSIPLYHWFRNLLEISEFSLSENVIVLAWSSGTSLPGDREDPSISIRRMQKVDLDAVEGVDREAFSPVWQTSRFTLEGAFAQSALATVAEIDSRIVGYQISTATTRGGHLARLAVDPGVQGRGIGFAILRDALIQFLKRGAQTVTVNTQKSNLSSLAIYQKAGFISTGEDYPVYQYMIE